VAEIEYDPNRTARIALLHYADGEKTHILAPDGCAAPLVRNRLHDAPLLGICGAQRHVVKRTSMRP